MQKLFHLELHGLPDECLQFGLIASKPYDGLAFVRADLRVPAVHVPCTDPQHRHIVTQIYSLPDISSAWAIKVLCDPHTPLGTQSPAGPHSPRSTVPKKDRI